MTALHRHLEQLYARTDLVRRDADPVHFVHRYTAGPDRELAGVFASGLAYGRVSLFFPVLHRLFEVLDARGGPHAFLAGFRPDHAAPLLDLVYRFNRGVDLALLCDALRATLERHGSVEGLFRGGGPLRERLAGAVASLRADAVALAPRHGLDARSFDELPRGLRYLLPSPADGSACKRWNLYLRWMVRPPLEGVDVGLWTAVTPAELVIPLDTHVGRIARLVGLTRRTDGSWRTAEEVTAALRDLDPVDPLRFDFVLAHLGISGGCVGRRVPAICGGCPLDPVCAAP